MIAFGRGLAIVCAALLSAAPVTSAMPAPPASPGARPLSADMQTHIRAAVARDLAAYGGKTPVPGVLLGVWTPDRGSMVAGIGSAQLSPARALSLADHVRIGSNTKTFVVTALLQLVDANRMSLDDPVSRFKLPVRVRGGAKITVRQLMQMRSGIVEIFNLPGLQRAAIDPNVPIDRVKWTQAACDAPRLFAPGTKWYYSNTNYMLLGMILEALTHDTVEHQLASRIFAPMHLTQTSFPTVSPRMPAPYAHGYTLTNGAWVDASNSLPPSLSWAAGVMVSNVADMKRWVEAYVGGTQNGAATQRARLACLPTTDPGFSFGLGIACTGGWYGYTGGIPGYNTAAYYLPSARATIIAFVTSQRDEPIPGVANAIARDVAKLVTPAHVPFAAVTATAVQNVPWARTSIVSVRAPSGPAAYRHGTLRLSNGATLRIEAASPGEPVAAYGPPREYADAGDARAMTVLDLKTSGSDGNVVESRPNAR